MAFASEFYPGDGSTKEFTVPFPYLAQEHIKVSLDGVDLTQDTDYTFLSVSAIQFTVAPATGVTVGIRRETPRTARIVNYQDAALLDEATLDQDSDQLLFIAQEGFDLAENSLRLGTDNTYDVGNRRIKNLADPVADTDAVNKQTVVALTAGAVTDAMDAASAAAVSAASAEAQAMDAASYADNAAASAIAADSSADAAALSASEAAASAASVNPSNLLTKDGNLDGLTDLAQARAALGLGSAATKDAGTVTGQVPLIGTESATTSKAGLVRLATGAEALAGTGTGVVAAADLPSAVASLATEKVMYVRDEKASGTEGGASIAGTQTRTLNTVVLNTITGASLASNQVTLPAGTYRITGSVPASSLGTSGGHRAILYNVTDSATLALGTSDFAGGGSSTAYIDNNRSFINCQVTLAAQKVIELRHYTQAAAATRGLGRAASSGDVEVFSELFITKVA